jgi:putative DNA primase/helicase
MSASSGVASPPSKPKTQTTNYRTSNAEIIACAKGRWPEILTHFNIPAECLNNRHVTCPLPSHGGENDFRFDNRQGNGNWICTCSSGDGINLIALYRGIENHEAFKLVATYLNLSGNSPLQKNNVKQLSNPIEEQNKQQAMKLEQDQKLLTRKKVAGAYADNILSNCIMRPHPYLQNKGIDKPVLVNTRNYKVTDKQIVYANSLIIPIYDISNNELISVQFINADGTRGYIAGSLISEGIHTIQGNDCLPYVSVVEGFCTGLSVHMATGATVIVTFDANGVKGKAERLNVSFFGKRLAFMGDNDSDKSNTGNKAAMEAATKTNGIAVIPPEAGDWNDYHQTHGLDAAKAEIERQLSEAQKVIKELEMQTKDECLVEEMCQQELKKEKSGFELLEKALIYYDKKEDGTTKAITISSRIEVEASQSDLYNDKSEGMTLKCKNKRGKTIKLSIPRRLLADERELCSLFFDIGLSIYKKKLLMGYLMDSNPQKHYSSVSRMGWHHFNENDFFVLPGQTIGHSNDKNTLVYQSDNLNTLFKSKGTLKEWRENISKLCAGNSRLVFALSHGLASMLLSPTNSTNGGINLFGESSTGKTTIARVCGSIFSDPNYVESCRTTTNALENTAHSHNDCLLILDEISQMNSKDMGDTVYTLCNGMGKARMRANTDSQPIIKFRNNYLFTGEIPVYQHTREGGNRETEGQLVRVLDIPAVTGEHGVFDCLPEGIKSGAEFSNYLKEQSTRYYGTCVIAFLEELTKPQNIIKIPEKFKQVKEQLVENLPQKVQGQTERAINRFALAACAGELATEWNLTGWQPNEAVTSARKCLDAWLTERGGVGNKEGSKLLQQVRAFFATNGESRFTDINNQEQSKTINRAGFKELINDEWIYYVYPHAFEEIHKGFTKNFAIKTLRESNWIETTINTREQIEVCKQKKIPKHGNGRFYTFNKLMWE